MTPTFVIDALPARAQLYRDDHAIVAIDVFRASTTIVTALAGGRRVFPVPTVDEALRLAAELPGALLGGEQAGLQPDGFDLQNSPSEVERLHDRHPLVLVTSAGTVLLASAMGAPAIYVGCFRNLTATAERLAEQGRNVALIGAGTRGETRAEDQMACAWLGQRLTAHGFQPHDRRTELELELWADVDLASLRAGPSAGYLRGSGQGDDIDFVLARMDDVYAAAEFDGHEVRLVDAARSSAAAESA
jgi:2-phosphosulfolactate phosphatase